MKDKQIAPLRAFVAVRGLDGRPGRLEGAGIPSVGLEAVLGVHTLGQRLLLGEEGILLLRLVEGGGSMEE